MVSHSPPPGPFRVLLWPVRILLHQQSFGVYQEQVFDEVLLVDHFLGEVDMAEALNLGRIWMGDGEGGGEWKDYEKLFPSRDEFVILKERVQELEKTVDKERLAMLHLIITRLLSFMHGMLLAGDNCPQARNKDIDTLIAQIDNEFFDLRGIKRVAPNA